MRRTSKVVTSSLLICALAAVTVPAGIHLAPAFLPEHPAAVAQLPGAQAAPTQLAAVAGIETLSDDAPLPDAAALTAALNKSLTYDGDGRFGVYVADALTGQVLYTRDGARAATPASNLKLLTAAAAVSTLDPESRFTTRVVMGEGAGNLVLIAGGDVMLGEGKNSPDVMGHAGLASLAEQVAASLGTTGRKGPVTITVDDTLFTGSPLNSKWAGGDVDAGEIAPIYPMALNAGRFAAAEQGGPRPQDSAVAVAEAFAKALEKAGVSTTGAIKRGFAPGTAPADPPGAAPAVAAALVPGVELGAVRSATVAQQTQYMLAESDNYVAEVLGRMTAAKLGLPASNTGAISAVEQAVMDLGLNVDGLTMTDVCGLAVGNSISPQKFVELLRLMLVDPGSDAASALPGLPIAGLSGSLTQRYTSGGNVSGAGLVRAKTGSLNEVTSLSGYVVNTEGRMLVFSILGNGFSDGAAAARPVVDAAATVLATS